MNRTILIGVASLLLGGVAAADAFNPAQIPAKAKWFLHADVKRFKATQLGGLAVKQLAKLDAVFLQIEKVSGLDPRRDLAGVTLYGIGTKEDEVAVLVAGQFNREKLEALVKLASEHRAVEYGAHTIHSWRDDKGPHFGCVFNAQMVVLSDGQPTLLAALDVLNGKGQVLKPNAALARVTAGNEPFVLLGMVDFEALGHLKPEANLLEKLKVICLAAGEVDEDFHGRLFVQPREARDALSVQQAIQGLVAIVQLGDSKKPEIKQAQDLARRLKIDRDEPFITVHLKVPAKELLESIKLRLEGEVNGQGKKPAPEK